MCEGASDSEDASDYQDSWWESQDRRNPKELIEQETTKSTLLINMGKHQEAIKLLSDLIRLHPDVFTPYVARGSAYALERDYERALLDMTRAIELSPSYADAWVRRSQIRSAVGDTQGSLSDLRQAQRLEGQSPSSLTSPILSLEYGQYELTRKNLTGALSIFEKALKTLDDSKLTTILKYQIAKTYLEMGEIFKARGVLREILKSDANFVPALSEMGQVLRELNKFKQADEHFVTALDLISKGYTPDGVDSQYTRLMLHLRMARLRHWAGELALTVECTREAIDSHLGSTMLEMAYYLAGSYHGLGQFESALTVYGRAISHSPTHFIFYLEQICILHHGYFDTPLKEYNWDNLFSPQFKECWGMRRDTKECLPKIYKVRTYFGDYIPALDLDHPLSPSLKQILPFAKHFGSKILYNSPGFVTNRKQIVSSGCAIIQAAQTVRAILNGGEIVLDGKSSSHDRKQHLFGWRDFFDILVRWRQAVEPLDAVWWIDNLTPESFKKGYGTTTPLILGETKNIRYFSYFSSVFKLLQFLLPLQNKLKDEQVYQILTAKTLHEVYSVFRSDVSVLTPCYSSLSPGTILDGSRLLLHRSKEGPGYMLEISTSAVPPRWALFSLELQSSFQNITNQSSSPVSPELALKLSLNLAYYWFQFMPLSRGSAAVGIQAINAVLLAFGYEVDGSIPKGVQLDWEAMLRSRPEDFADSLSSWLRPGLLKRVELDVLNGIPSLEEGVATLRDMFSIFNEEIKLDEEIMFPKD